MQAPLCLNLNNIKETRDSINWESHHHLGRAGALIHRLYCDPCSGQQVALIKCMPGAKAEAHIHQGHETFLILDGEFQDDYGLYRRGDLVIYKPGSTHAWSTPKGALVYAVWGGPVSSLQS